jgi:hypothetical protein
MSVHWLWCWSIAISARKSAAVLIAKTVRCIQWSQAISEYCRASTLGDLWYTADQVSRHEPGSKEGTPPETWHTGPSETLYWFVIHSFSIWWMFCALRGGLLHALTPRSSNCYCPGVCALWLVRLVTEEQTNWRGFWMLCFLPTISEH